MNEPLFTPEQLAEIEAYHFPHYVWAAVGDGVNLVVCLLVLWRGVAPMFRFSEWAAAALAARWPGLRKARVPRVVLAALDRLWGGPGWGAALLFAGCDFAVGVLAFLPVDVYFGYVLEHRFGLSRYTPFTFAVDELKETAAALAPTLAVAFGLFALARRLDRWWLVLGLVAAMALLGSAALDPYRGRYYFDQRPLEEGPLRVRLTGLLRRAGVEFSDIVVEKTSRATVKVQAYFAGQGRTRAIVLNDSLLAQLEDDEVLAAVAHEAAHTRESRWPNRVAAALALLAFLFGIDRLFRRAARSGWLGTHRFADIRTLPLVALVFYLAAGVTGPVAAAFSRGRELEADAFALRLTGDPGAFRRMLVKAARVNKMDPNPPRWVVLKGWSHPPIGERLAAVDRGDWKNTDGR